MAEQETCLEGPGGSVIHRFGNTGEPLVVVDDFSANPDALVATADAQTFGAAGPYYPGIRAPADAQYLGERMALLETLLRDVFGAQDGARLVECSYSLVTTAPTALAPIQRLPHIDSTDPGRIAVLHYLCGPEHGGTAFFRHRSTGLETVTEAGLARYPAALDADAAGGIPEGYVDASHPYFEQIGAVEARWNRLVIYRGYRLHSGIIPPDLDLVADPHEGRLTVNTFLQAR